MSEECDKKFASLKHKVTTLYNNGFGLHEIATKYQLSANDVNQMINDQFHSPNFVAEKLTPTEQLCFRQRFTQPPQTEK